MTQASRTITEGLEEKARVVRQQVSRSKSLDATISFLEQEIGLTSEQLDKVRESHDQQLRGLLRAETYIDTDLMKLDSYHLRQFVHRHKVRDNLKTKLLKLDIERRTLITSHEDQESKLHLRLLSLLQEHAIASPHVEDQPVYRS